MSQIVDDRNERHRLRAGDVETKLDAMARLVADEARRAAERSRMIAIVCTASPPRGAAKAARSAA